VKDFLFILLQHLLPHHGISRVAGWLATTNIRWVKSLFIEKFSSHYSVNMSEAAEENLDAYSSFNDFFCRALKPDARPIAEGDNILACPADGAISQLGNIEKDTIFQAKGKSFSATTLLGGDKALSERFSDGHFCTVYLSPKDYHRIHMPITGKLVSMNHVPGALFSVNPATVSNVDNLFARNERVACIFETEIGPVALVLVGAMIVASIETVWAGEIAPRRNQVTHFQYQTHDEINLNKGEEMGRFKLGSTVILLLPKGAGNWVDRLTPGRTVTMGEPLFTLGD